MYGSSLVKQIRRKFGFQLARGSNNRVSRRDITLISTSATKEFFCVMHERPGKHPCVSPCEIFVAGSVCLQFRFKNSLDALVKRNLEIRKVTYLTVDMLFRCYFRLIKKNHCPGKSGVHQKVQSVARQHYLTQSPGLYVHLAIASDHGASCRRKLVF